MTDVMPERPPAAPRARKGRTWLRRLARLIPFVGVIVVLAGLAVLVNAFGNPWILAGIVFFGVVATIPRGARWLMLIACACLVAMLALIGFNVGLGYAVGWLRDSWVKGLPDEIVDPQGRLGIELGLGLAVIVFGAAAYFYLRGTWKRVVPSRWKPPPLLRRIPTGLPDGPRWVALTLSAGLAIGVILVVPVVASDVSGKLEESPAAAPVETPIRAELDVLIVADRRYPQAAELGSDRARGGFVAAYARAVDLDVRYGIGLARGSEVTWTHSGIADAKEARAALAAEPQENVDAPQRRDRADGAIVLLVDGTPPVVERPEELEDVAGTDGEVERWAAVARAVRAGTWQPAPVYALLQTTRDARLARWQSQFEELGGAVSIQALGSQTVTDAAVRLAVGTSATGENYWLAMKHRPILVFDNAESVPRPLSIEAMFEDDLVHQCSDLEPEGTCATEPVERAEDLRSPGMHLVISRPERLNALAERERDEWLARPAEPVPSDLGAAPAGTPPAITPEAGTRLGQGSRIYFHPVLVEQDERSLLHLDYWWYLIDNPAGTGRGAFCGAGLVILGVTCFNHESDWEGVTVVLERIEGEWQELAVYYAQHESIVRYEWEDLRAHWDGGGGLPEEMRDRLPDHEDRPLVFVARGTHAGYAERCPGDCRQVATKLEEGDRDGGLPWVGNDTAACLRIDCLYPLPTGAGGGPASWNAFEGPWGRRHCAWTYYCDSGTPPPAPGQQDRYLDPKRFDGRAKVADPGSFEEEES